ncbi:phosphoribosylglycinamide formyltransferase [Synechococcus sp. CS-1325]|nr:phosphoribosylglycinamide formyltransferase [Synechococcus sp. CS-1325]MCT0231787.1 phosphoribosylglycinamide formyltransferase [Synechococcus sp. CS-1324]PZV03003.1 MAG: phosphoribosylglycinamide formyltransferase [Cyanobium sp.]PZV05788.1 MAG: phosphoribosylglycinamide formyltransferase [Cyanobium sp.]
MERCDMNPLPAAPDTSDGFPSVQWPLPQPWPILHPFLRLGVLASGHGSNFEALLSSCRDGPLNATVALLVVNNPGCGAQRRAEQRDVPCQLIDHRLHPQRRNLDREILAAFEAARVDLVVMAGWMRIVSPVLIDAFAGRLINIHPSLLPSFPGLDAIGQALAAGVALTGCTAHLVTEAVDAGPILVQAAVPVLAGDDRTSLGKRIHRQEHRILPLAVALAAQRLAAPPGSPSSQG